MTIYNIESLEYDLGGYVITVKSTATPIHTDVIYMHDNCIVTLIKDKDNEGQINAIIE